MLAELTPELLALTAADARGKYLVCSPNLGGTDEVLLNLRGSAQLCMDVIDQPEKILPEPAPLLLLPRVVPLKKGDDELPPGL
jgi:hypothetical protein